MYVDCVCMYVNCVCVFDAHRHQKQTLYLLELDFPLAVSHHVISFVTPTVLSDDCRKNGEHGELS